MVDPAICNPYNLAQVINCLLVVRYMIFSIALRPMAEVL